MQLYRDKTEIESCGVKLYVVGNGYPNEIENFQEITGYTDPSREVYRAAGMVRSVTGTIGPRSWWSAAKRLTHGHRQGSLQGDAWQLGGALAVSISGEVLWRKASTSAAENVSPRELVEMLS